MSLSQCRRVKARDSYLHLHGLVFETSIYSWQDQPGKSHIVVRFVRRRASARAPYAQRPSSLGARPKHAQVLLHFAHRLTLERLTTRRLEPMSPEPILCNHSSSASSDRNSRTARPDFDQKKHSSAHALLEQPATKLLDPPSTSIYSDVSRIRV